MSFRISAPVRIIAIGTSLLALAGCAPQGPNQWVPKGYSYQDNTPLSSPAPSSPWLKEAEIKNTEKLAASTAAWQGSVFELVSGLQASIPVDGTALFVKSVPPVINQDLALDHYVRQALLQKGVTLTTTSGMGHTLLIDARPLTNEDALKQAKTVAGFEYVEGMTLDGIYLLTAQLVDQSGKPVADSKSVGVFPYEKAEYNRLPGFSVLPTGGMTTKPVPVYERQ